jgi:putative oxidoreductase
VGMTCFYSALITIGNFLQSFLLLAIRLFWGYLFFKGGLGKLQDISPVIEFFHSLGIPFPTVMAYLVGLIECVGGLCLMLGFASRLVAIPLATIMIVAYLTAHYDAVKNVLENHSEFIKQTPFNFLLTCLLIFAFGPGKISLDYLLKRFVFKPSQ